MLRTVGKYRRHIAEIGIGLFLYEGYNFVYDWLFYPFAIFYWGLVEGGIIAFLGSLIQCALMFWLYDHMRVDWLGAHALRSLEEKENKNRFERAAVWIGKGKKSIWERALTPFIFIALTLPIDPLIVAIHYRRKHFTGITLGDWGILLSAVLAANTWWLFKVGLIVEFLLFLWKLLFT